MPMVVMLPTETVKSGTGCTVCHEGHRKVLYENFQEGVLREFLYFQDNCWIS